MKNIEILTEKITKKIGYTIHNKEIAIELLQKYPESASKTVNRFIANNGVCNGKVYFK